MHRTVILSKCIGGLDGSVEFGRELALLAQTVGRFLADRLAKNRKAVAAQPLGNRIDADLGETPFVQLAALVISQLGIGTTHLVSFRVPGLQTLESRSSR